MASDDALNTIIDSLKETDELPRKQIAEIVEVLGSEVALGLLADVKRVQEEGGIAVRDGTRRRTDGGVFFSLAKAKLPKADRNRIFRVRPPRPEGAEAEAAQESPAPAPARSAVAEERRVARSAEASAPSRGQQVSAGGAGRRRVVEVEVLRHHPKPAPPPPPENGVASAPRVAAVREAPPPPAEVRPLRRIVQVAPAREQPPTTPEAAIERVRTAISGLGAPDRRRVLADLLRELGGVAEAEPKKVEAKKPEPKPKEEKQGLDDATRERVLASVTDALGLSTSDLARVLYGEETAGTRSKARGVLDRFRKSGR